MNSPGIEADSLTSDGVISGTPHRTLLPLDFEDGGSAQRLVENRFKTDLDDVALEVDVAETSSEQVEAQPEILRHREPEVIQSEAPVGLGVMQGMFSCVCEPCEPASGDLVKVSGEPVLVSTMPSNATLPAL